jgi:MEMO1 family protein
MSAGAPADPPSGGAAAVPVGDGTADVARAVAAGDGTVPGATPATSPADYARRCVEALAGGRPAPPAPAEPFYGRVAACFCSLKKHGELRGCIGTLAPMAPTLGDEIAHNAFAAAFRDPRFGPVTVPELDALAYSVDVLSPSEPCERDGLDPRRYGVIVSAQERRGVLLPDLAGVETVDRQLAIALGKAGIAPGEPFAIERFTVSRFGEAGCDEACG